MDSSNPIKKSRKIQIKYRENKGSRMVTFTKRRKGLFSMASTLSELTGAKIAVIAISQAGTAYFDGSMAAIDHFLAANPEEPMPAGYIAPGDWIDQTLAYNGPNMGDNLVEVKREAEDAKKEDRFGLVEVKKEDVDLFGLVFGDQETDRRS